MINYEPTESSFYEANKKYCEEIENQLITIDIDCQGFCNCYGYDIEATIPKDNLTYTIKYHRHQTTQNGIVIPFDAIGYAGVMLSVTGIDKKFRLAVGKSSFKRFFCSAQIKASIPHPYFICSNQSTELKLIIDLLEKLQNNKIDSIQLSNGRIICKIHVPTANPLQLIDDIDTVVKTLV